MKYTIADYHVGQEVMVIDYVPEDFQHTPCFNTSVQQDMGTIGMVCEINRYVQVRFPNGHVWDFLPHWLYPVTPVKKPEQRRGWSTFGEYMEHKLKQ